MTTVSTASLSTVSTVTGPSQTKGALVTKALTLQLGKDERTIKVFVPAIFIEGHKSIDGKHTSLDDILSKIKDPKYVPSSCVSKEIGLDRRTIQHHTLDAIRIGDKPNQKPIMDWIKDQNTKYDSNEILNVVIAHPSFSKDLAKALLNPEPSNKT